MHFDLLDEFMDAVLLADKQRQELKRLFNAMRAAEAELEEARAKVAGLEAKRRQAQEDLQDATELYNSLSEDLDRINNSIKNLIEGRNTCESTD